MRHANGIIVAAAATFAPTARPFAFVAPPRSGYFPRKYAVSRL
jgi:hypothetical protein